MGCDTHITLPSETRVVDVAKVMGALAGYEKTTEPLKGSDAIFCRVAGQEVSPCNCVVEMCTINLTEPTIDGEEGHSAFYHFEGIRTGERLVSVRSTPFWIAMGLKLIKFFGGSIDFNDCQGEGPDRTYDKPRPSNYIVDDEEWSSFQQEILDIEPITKQDIVDAADHAAYDSDYVDKFREELLVPETEALIDAMLEEAE